MNPLKCAFGVSSGKFLGFLVHSRGIDVDLAKATNHEATCHGERIEEFFGKSLTHSEVYPWSRINYFDLRQITQEGAKL